MKKLTAITSAALAAAVLISGCGSSKTAMQIGDISVSQGDIEIVTDAYMPSSADYNTAKTFAVDMMEKAITVYAVAQARGYSLTEEEEQQVVQGKASFATIFGSASDYKKALRSKGGDDKIIEAFIAEPLYEEKLQADADLPEVTDEEAKEYFKQNYRRAKHVLLMTEGEDKDFVKSRAENILERAQNGENFDDLVTNFSQDPGSTSNPDGYIFTDDEMVKEFDDAVKSIQPGEFTLCESSIGYHVIQRLPLDESEPKFNEFFEEYKEAAKNAKTADNLEAAIASMAEEAGITIEVFDDVINAIPSPTPVATDEPSGETETAETAASE